MQRLNSYRLFGLVLLLASACSSKMADGGDSETHWFSICAGDADCGKGATCLCGICTVKCEPSSRCDGAPDSATCVAASGYPGCAGGSPPANLCLRPSDLHHDAATPLPSNASGDCPAGQFAVDVCNACGPADGCESFRRACTNTCTSETDCKTPGLPTCVGHCVPIPCG